MATGAPSFESIVETYLPEIVRQHLHARPFVGAHVEDLSGVAMFADMTGFTKVTEMLAGYPNGAELISATVNDFFRALLRHVHAGGGDVVSFAGDAVLVVWACTPTEGWRTVLMKAVQCIQAMTRDRLISHFPVTAPNRDTVHLTYHTGVGVGSMTGLVVGSGAMWRYLLTGEAIHQCTRMSLLGQDGEFVLSGEVHEMLKDHCDAEFVEKMGSSGQHLSGYRIRSLDMNDEDFVGLRVDMPHTPLPGPVMPHGPDSEEDLEFLNDEEAVDMPQRVKQRLKNSKLCFNSTTTFDDKAMKFLFDVVHRAPHECNGQIRSVHTLFIQLKDAVQALSPGEIRELQLVFEYLFGALLDLDGVCNKVLMDDKGLVVLCVFGLPYHSHEDDALRAAEFAATFVRRIERVTGRVAVGLSRAKVYCGNIGGARRKEFTVLGRGVNVSARLMQAAARHNDIKSTVLVTKEVFQDLKDHPNFAFGEPLPQELKGVASAVTVYPLQWSQFRRESGLGSSSSLMRQRSVLSHSRGSGRYSDVCSVSSFSSCSSLSHHSSYHSQRVSVLSPGAARLSPFSPALTLTPRRADPLVVDTCAHSVASDAAEGVLAGRQHERRLVGAVIEGLCTTGDAIEGSRALVLHGDAGMGKTALLTQAQHLAIRHGVDWVLAGGDIREAGTLLYGVKTFFFQLLEILVVSDPMWRRKLSVKVKLLVPWLESINPEALGVTPVCRSAHSDPAARVPTVPKLVELALELMHLHHSPHGLLLFVEDAQWLDALSFEFFAKVLIAHPRLALIMALRYDVQRSESARRSSCSAGNSSRRYSNEAMSEATEKVPEETFLDNKALTAATHMQQVHLDPLSTWECTDLLALHFKVRKVDAELAALVFRHSSGNPGFAEQFIGSLQDNGKLLTGGDTVTLGNDVDLDKMGVPEKVEHVIVSRIDKLSTKQGYILRMLSVIGSEFTIALISQYLEEPVVECRARVEELVQCGFLFARRFSAYTSVTCLQSESTARTETQYGFKLKVFATVIYNGTLYSERMAWHRKILRVLERQDPARNSFLLAYHYQQLNDPKALLSYAAAAEEAWEGRYAQRCVRMIEQARAFALQSGLLVPTVMATRWEYLLAACYCRLQDHHRSIPRIQTSLKLLGHGFWEPAAPNWCAQFKATVKRLVRGLGQWCRPTRGWHSKNAQYAELLAMLNNCHYYCQDKQGLLRSSRLGLLAVQHQPAALQAEAHCWMAMVALTLKSPQEAHRHWQRTDALTRTGQHKPKTYELAAWYHFCRRDVDAMHVALEEGMDLAPEDDELGPEWVGLRIVAILNKALECEYGEASILAENATRQTLEMGGAHPSELMVITALVRLFFQRDCAQVACMTTRLSSVQRSHGRSEGLFCASVVLIDLLVPVLQCYGAYLDGHAGTAAAERRAEDLLSGGALARACAIPTVYAALAVAMLLEVLIGRTTAAPGLEAPVEKALGHLAALAKRLPIARPMSLMWGAWWQHLQGNTNEAILQLNQVTELATAMSMPFYTQRADYLSHRLGLLQRCQSQSTQASSVGDKLDYSTGWRTPKGSVGGPLREHSIESVVREDSIFV